MHTHTHTHTHTTQHTHTTHTHTYNDVITLQAISNYERAADFHRGEDSVGYVSYLHRNQPIRGPYSTSVQEVKSLNRFCCVCKLVFSLPLPSLLPLPPPSYTSPPSYGPPSSYRSANKCLIKVAHMCATLQQFDKAASLFEEVRVHPPLLFQARNIMCHCFLPSLQIGRNSLENTLLKYGAKDYFFKASICLFCKGPAEAKVCDCVTLPC